MVECAHVLGSGMRSRPLILGAYAVCWQDKMSLAGAQAKGVGARRLHSHTVMPRTHRKLHSLVAGLFPCASCLSQAQKAVGEARRQLTMFRSEEGHRP